MQTYKDLVVWQKSISLVEEIYKATALLPVEEKFVLLPQMRRSAISIPSNIAEGYARKSRKENAQFINIAFASGIEMETQILIAKKLYSTKFANWEAAEKLLDEVLRMLYRYRQSLN